MNTISIIDTYDFNHPRQNLGPPWSSGNAEDCFTRSFTQSYNNKYEWIHPGSLKKHRILMHEVPVSSFGIADLVTVSWKKNGSIINEVENYSDFFSGASPTVRAFEVKLTDWRRGLMQAHRYRYFADVSILVIPHSKSELAKQYLTTFYKLNVGLWSFNEDNESILKIFTPRPKRPAIIQHRNKAIERVFAGARQGRNLFTSSANMPAGYMSE